MIGRSQDETGIMSIADKLPIIAIQGLDDQHIIPDKLENLLKRNFAKIEYHGLPDVGHAPFWENPDTTNKLILEFVQNHSN
jgi:pimeloyl-ACP methyl ester carboxylesterase